VPWSTAFHLGAATRAGPVNMEHVVEHPEIQAGAAYLKALQQASPDAVKAGAKAALRLKAFGTALRLIGASLPIPNSALRLIGASPVELMRLAGVDLRFLDPAQLAAEVRRRVESDPECVQLLAELKHLNDERAKDLGTDNITDQCFRLAGLAGVDPGPESLRTLDEKARRKLARDLGIDPGEYSLHDLSEMARGKELFRTQAPFADQTSDVGWITISQASKSSGISARR
jgi:hypothetical protein